jgi:hypothetical protein
VPAWTSPNQLRRHRLPKVATEPQLPEAASRSERPAPDQHPRSAIVCGAGIGRPHLLQERGSRPMSITSSPTELPCARSSHDLSQLRMGRVPGAPISRHRSHWPQRTAGAPPASRDLASGILVQFPNRSGGARHRAPVRNRHAVASITVRRSTGETALHSGKQWPEHGPRLIRDHVTRHKHKAAPDDFEDPRATRSEADRDSLPARTTKGLQVRRDR